MYKVIPNHNTQQGAFRSGTEKNIARRLGRIYGSKMVVDSTACFFAK